MADKVNGVALASVAAGLTFVFAGIKGYSIPQTLQDIVQGKSPLKQAQTTDITTPASTPVTAASVATSAAQTAGGVYDHAQIMSLWVLAGGSTATANNAACHAMQESSGNPDVLSSNPDGGTNVGLWQLDTPGGVGAGHSVAQLQNALTNARITVQATKDGADWSDWSTPGC